MKPSEISGNVFLIVLIGVLSVAYVCEALGTKLVTLGQQVKLQFPTDIDKIEKMFERESRPIVEKGALTDWARKMFGDRVSYARDGTLTIRDIKPSDMGDYEFEQGRGVYKWTLEKL
ncbi:unnamed protein product [Anisakis simplex]|uniref:Conserved domain protein n=1 Tax=Anisakis simplex TaxID=6269 RepID=A0A0M3JWV1_ANISI|nr:unnamed protein product [Anisakis simplex]